MSNFVMGQTDDEMEVKVHPLVGQAVRHPPRDSRFRVDLLPGRVIPMA